MADTEHRYIAKAVMFDDFVKQMWQILADRKIALKKKELAAHIGISASQLREFVSGRYRSNNVAEKIADYLNMAMVYMDGRYMMIEKRQIRMR